MSTSVIVTRGGAKAVVVTRGIPGPPGPNGPPGAGLHLSGVLADVGDLPATAEVGDAYLIAGDLHVYDGAAFVNAGAFRGPPGHPGQIRFTGHGAPPVLIVGAEPGDTYLDLDTGDIYKLS